MGNSKSNQIKLLFHADLPAQRGESEDIMTFTKYNNPNRRKARRNTYSREYKQARYEELCQLLSQCNTDSEREILTKAYNVSINP